MALEFGLTGDGSLKNAVVKVEIGSSGGSQDITYRGIHVAHVQYPGDFESNNGATTYVRVENPPETYLVNFNKDAIEDFPAYVVGHADGQGKVDIRNTTLVVKRK